jgi:hypothetical protein
MSLAATACLSLSACGGSDGSASGNAAAAAGASQGSASASGGGQGSASPSGASQGSASASGAGAATITPGLYETSVSVNVGGLPETLAKSMQGSVEKQQDCVTPEEAAKGSADLFGKKDDNCQSKDVVFAGGRIHGTLVCRGKGGEGEGAATITLDGSYTSTGYDVTANMVTQAGGKKMTVETRVVGRRVGECKAGSEG